MRSRADRKGTQPVRLYADLAEKLSDILEHGDGRTSAEILDPMIRGPIERMYEQVRPLVEAIAAAKAQHRHTPAPV